MFPRIARQLRAQWDHTLCVLSGLLDDGLVCDYVHYLCALNLAKSYLLCRQEARQKSLGPVFLMFLGIRVVEPA